MTEDSKEVYTPRSSIPESHSDSPSHSLHASQDVPPVQSPQDTLWDEDEQPPPYGEIFGHIENDQEDLSTGADVADDGRVNIRINQRSNRISNLFRPALQHQPELKPDQIPYIPPDLTRRADRTKPPILNIAIHVVGSRGDVQPFVALGKVLREQYHHRVRLATHEVFRKFVVDNGLEFFSIGGDPSELMAFMVKNPGLMPGFDVVRSGDVGHRRKEIARMVKGCWRSCIEPGDGTGPEVSDSNLDMTGHFDAMSPAEPSSKPFVADAIIANPPSFAHVHIAERLGIPLHMMFTMPWSPTQAFPHPLANIQSTNAGASMSNFMSYALVDMMTWQGLGDVINRFRRKSLGLDPISLTWAPGMLARLKIPYTYCWSPALIPKPRDWASHISISGFYFLNLATDYTPEPDLEAFLNAGPKPVYIGFGSIVLDDPDGMTKLIFDAVKETGQRALVSKGWGGFGADQIGVPENVFMLGNVPHDWLFERVSCVVHHGGAGTTAAGISAGKPTVIVPFFGDQPFWGSMVARAGAGPDPIPSKHLNSNALANAINEALKPTSVEKAKELSMKISKETGSETGAESFHRELNVDNLRCQLSPRRSAVWRIRRTDFRLSAFAATILVHERLLDSKDLKLYRPNEYDPDDGPWDPITGGASALIETMGGMAMGIADMPVATLKALKIHPERSRKKSESAQSPANRSSTPVDSKQESRRVSSADIQESKRESMQTLESSRTRASSTSSRGSELAQDEVAAAHTLTGEMMKGKAQEPPKSGDASSAKPSETGAEKQKPFKFNQEDLETMMSTGKGAWRFTETGVRSPLDFTLALAKGFHNAPKLYGDETVRKPEKITDFSSGLRAAGKGLGYGLYDGITGLVTQPIQGAKKEGAAGLVKGFGKGIGGIALKPGAGFWGVPGYAAQGVSRELRNRFGPSVEGSIIAARTAQGYDEMQQASSEEYDQLIKDWDDVKHLIRKKKHVGQEKMEEIKSRMNEVRSRSRSGSLASKCSDKLSRGQPSPLRKATDGPKSEKQLLSADGSYGGGEASRSAHGSPSLTATEDDELEEAIRRSIAETSQGDPEMDQAIEKAIRASVADLEKARARGAGDEELNKAVAGSLAEAKKGNLRKDAASSKDKQAKTTIGNEESSVDASARDEELERVLHESKSTASGPDEEQLRLAMSQSKDAHDKHSAEQKMAADEEEVVMRYVMKQSQAEEDFRQQRTGESST